MRGITLLMCVTVAAQNPTGQAPQPVSLSGSVINAITGAPVKKARVMLQVNNARGAFSGPTNTATDLSGHFTFAQLPPGSYAVRAEHPNYPHRMRGGLGPEDFTSVTLNAGQSKSDLTIKLTPGSAITGKVTNEESEPMSQCSIQLMQRMLENGRSVLGGMNGTSTNERGEYRLFNIPAGRYYVQSRCMRTIPQPHPLRPRDAAVSQATAAYPILFYPNSMTQDGAARIAVEPGTDLQGIDFRFTPIRSVTVSGRVVFPDSFSGRPPGASISLLRKNANGDADPIPVSSTGVRPDGGRFVLMNVPPGSYWLQAGMYMPEHMLYARETLEVGENPIVDLTIHLKSALDLTATVEHEKAPEGSQPPRYPVQDNLWIQPVDMRGPMGMGGGGRLLKEADGSYRIRRLTPGKWEIRASMGYVKSVRIGDRETEGGMIEITGSESDTMKIVVSQRYGLVSGTVQGAAPGQQVSAILLPEASAGGRGNLRQMMIDQNGLLRTPAPPGRYRAIAVEGNDAYRLSEPAFEKFVAKHAQSVTVQVDGQATVVVPLVSKQAVEQAYREAMEDQP